MERFDITEYRNMVAEILREMWGEESEVEISTMDQVKNNGVVFHGIHFRGIGKHSGFTIYVDSYFGEDGKTPEEAALEISGTYHDFLRRYSGMELDIPGFDGVKDRIIYKLINYEMNEAQLKDRPHVRILDMAMALWVDIEADKENEITAPITNMQLKQWGVTGAELFRLALSNTPVLRPCRVQTMAGLMEHLCGGMMDALELLILEFVMEHPMFVMSDEHLKDGAGAALYKGSLRMMADILGKNLLVIPSSIHEMILMPVETAEEMEDQKDLVETINQKEVPRNEILAEQMYFYDRAEGTLGPAFPGDDMEPVRLDDLEDYIMRMAS